MTIEQLTPIARYNAWQEMPGPHASGLAMAAYSIVGKVAQCLGLTILQNHNEVLSLN